MVEINKQFVPYLIAVKLKGLGFDERCFGMYDTTGMLHYSVSTNMFHINSGIRDTESVGNEYAKCAAPLIQQTIDYLAYWHQINICVDIEFIGSDEWEYSYKITWLPKRFEDYKRRVEHFQSTRSFLEYGGTYEGTWPDRGTASIRAIEKALQIIEKDVA